MIPTVSSQENEVRRFLVGRSLLAVVLAGFVAMAAGQPVFAQADIERLAEKAEAEFQPVGEENVAAARAELRNRMKEIEAFVQPSSENGRRWLRYLRWDELKKEVNDPQPRDVEAAASTLDRLNRNKSGLEHRRFRALARALRKYRDTLALSMIEKPVEAFREQVTGMRETLEAYRKEPSANLEVDLSERLQILESFGHSRELVEAVRGELARPNAYVDVATAYLAAGLDPVNRNEMITDCILGVNIRGDAHTTGSTGIASIPSQNKAILEFRTEGHTTSFNVGHKSPAVIRSTAYTNFTATKRVELTDAAFLGLGARANATTNTQIHSVAKQGGGLGSRLVSRIGWQRAQQSEHQAEAIAADHAEDRVERRFNSEVNDAVRKLRKRYEEDYRRPLERRDEVPEHIRFSSGKDWVGVEVTQASRSQLGAQGDPPAASEVHDMTMRVHESAVNNYCASILGGATATQKSADEDIKFNVDLPKWMKQMWEERKTEPTDDPAAAEEPFKEYSMTLRDGRPLSVRFLDGQVRLTLHIAELTSGDKSYSNWDVSGSYKPELVEGRVVLRRDGKLEMLPTDFEGSLDVQQTGERSSLEKEFERRSAQGKGFPQTIEFDPLEPEGKLAKAGALGYREFSPREGWLVLGLDRQKKAAPLPSARGPQASGNPVRKLRVPSN